MPEEPGEPAPTSPSTPAAPITETGYTSSGVPTFDSVREKIETRYGAAQGAAELASETSAGRDAAQRYQARQRAGAQRLAQIRDAMRSENPDP